MTQILSALIGHSTVIRHVQHLVVKVAESDSPVLISGEMGTGKESVAKAIHEKSQRAEHPFIPVRCNTLAEQELLDLIFGQEGSQRCALEEASGGTIFLDEVSSLSKEAQRRLYQLINDGGYESKQGKQTLNTRIICSTGALIDQDVRRGDFREDLYYRLASCAIYIPPLRERKEDTSPLVNHFLQKKRLINNKKGLGISPDALQAMLQYKWPRNIQELENLIERITVLKSTGSIELCDLPPKIRHLVTTNIDAFYEDAFVKAKQSQKEKKQQEKMAQRMPPPSAFPNAPTPTATAGSSRRNASAAASNKGAGSRFQNGVPGPILDEGSSEIDRFIRKEIDLGNGIDFYKVVEEFENRLIAEALRRTNHNKNRAAQLLSMNRTTLVEKLKKRAANSTVKIESSRVKRNQAFTIFDGLGKESRPFDPLDIASNKSS